MKKDLIKNRKELEILILDGGFEPEKYASTLAGKNIAFGLKSAGYKNVTRLNVDKNVIKNIILKKPDFVFPAMLCRWGEDGIIQSLLEIMDIPYSGNGVEASSICNNKFFFTQFVKSCGIKVPSSIIVDSLEEARSLLKKIKVPSIVKPAYQGYSIGVSLCVNEKDLLKNIQEAFKYSTKVVIQDYIKGREFTIGVIETPDKGPIMLPPLELEILGNTIQDVLVKEESQKYLKRVANPTLSQEQIKKLEADAIKIFKLIGATGVSRFDIRMNDKGEFYYLENNTFPGIPNIQLAHITTQLRSAGISFENFVDYMVISGLKRKGMKLDFV